ncbi:MAG: hypothetical protein WA364_02700 [Candidatus Nitrosopolaris sp.]
MQNRNQRLIGLIAVAMLSTMILSVSASHKSYSQRQLTINGAGATFPFPLFDTWRFAYQKVHPNVNINYQSIGSGEGVKYIAPSLDSTQEAVSDAPVAKSLPAGDQSWTKVSLLNSLGANTYPIASFTYLLLHKDLSTNPDLDQTKAKALVDFISWAITDGQKLAANLGYVPLPAVVVKHDQDTLKSLTFKGTPLYRGK